MLKEKDNASCGDCAWRQTSQRVKPPTQIYLLAWLAASAEGGKMLLNLRLTKFVGFRRSNRWSSLRLLVWFRGS